MPYDKSKYQSPIIRAKIAKLKQASENLKLTKVMAAEKAREMVKRDIANAEAEQHMLIRDLYVLSLQEEHKRGLSAAEIKRAMFTTDHNLYRSIIDAVQIEDYYAPADWTLEEPYLSDPWVISDWYGSIYSDAGAKFRLTRFYKYEDYVGQEIVVQRVAKDSVLIQSELVTLFDLSNATDPDRNLHPDFLDAALPGVPEDRRREIVQALTDYVASTYGDN